MTEVVITGAARTPVGAFLGGLSSVPAHYLGEVAIKAALERAGVNPEEVSEVIMGQILAAGERAEPCPPSCDGCRHSSGKNGLWHQPALRLRSSDCSPRLSGYLGW